MRQFVRGGLAMFLVAGPVAFAASGQGTTPAKGQAPAKGQTPAATTKGQPAAKAVAAPPADADEVCATINGQPLKKSEIRGYLSQFAIPPGEEVQAYQLAVTVLTNTELLTQFLKSTKIDIPAQQIDEEIAKIEKDVKESQGVDLKTALAETSTTIDEMRTRISQSLQWKKYVTTKATDAELKKYYDTNQDLFDSTRVKASHILISAKPDASPAEKEAVKAKLVAIKKDIEAKKISFKDAANKYSEDPSNQQTKAGGELDGYFPRKGMYVEPFAAAAFALKPNQISDPVETEYGYHLILVTDRKEGEKIKFEEVKDKILGQYAVDLQNQIVADARKSAKIDVKPMPKDLFPPPPPGLVEPAGTPAGGAATKGAAPKGASTPKGGAAPR